MGQSGLKISLSKITISVLLDPDSASPDSLLSTFSKPTPATSEHINLDLEQELPVEEDTDRYKGTKSVGEWVQSLISTVFVEVKDVTVRVYFRSEMTGEIMAIELYVPTLCVSDVSDVSEEEEEGDPAHDDSDISDGENSEEEASSNSPSFSLKKKKIDFNSIQVSLLSFRETPNLSDSDFLITGRIILGRVSSSSFSEAKENQFVTPSSLKENLRRTMTQTQTTTDEFCERFGLCSIRFNHWLRSDIVDYLCTLTALKYIGESPPSSHEHPQAPAPQQQQQPLSSSSTVPQRKLLLPEFKSLSTFVSSAPSPSLSSNISTLPKNRKESFERLGLFTGESQKEELTNSPSSVIVTFAHAPRRKKEIAEIEADLNDFELLISPDHLHYLSDLISQVIGGASETNAPPLPSAPAPAPAPSPSPSEPLIESFSAEDAELLQPVGNAGGDMFQSFNEGSTFQVKIVQFFISKKQAVGWF